MSPSLLSHDNDLTYFILNQLRVILQAVADLHAYLQHRTEELRAVENVLRTARTVSRMINPRQLALLNHALKNPGHTYTFRSHQRSHGVSYQTARTDLIALQETGLLDAVRAGRTYHFASPTDLRRRIERLGRKPKQRR